MIWFSGGEASKGTSSTSLASSNPSFFSGNLYEKSRIHETFEEDLSPQKKSVLTKVKEKAKKLRHSLSSKKRHDDGILTPTSGFIMEEEEEEEEDAEYLGAPSNTIIIYTPSFPCIHIYIILHF